ncbi:uncharacterized protein LOC144645272 isoform X1 [Oculina patagonica]
MARSSNKVASQSDVTSPTEEAPDDDTQKAIAEDYKNKGNVEYRKKELHNAICFYTEGIKVHCTDDELNAKLYNNRAIAQFYLGNYLDSLNDARVATKLQPNYLKAIERGARACMKLNMFEEAITWCDKGLAIEKNTQSLFELRIKAVQEQKEFQESSRDESKDRLETQSGKDTHVEDKRISKLPASVARSPIKTASESDVTPPAEETLDFDDVTKRAIADVYRNEGNDEYRKKDFSKAIYFYTEGIKVNCKDDELNAKLYSNRAIAHFYLENYSASLDDARAATEMQPHYLKAIVRGASACMKLNRFGEAITWCDKGLRVDKKNRILLDLKSTAVKEQKKLQESVGDKAKNSKTQTVKDKVNASLQQELELCSQSLEKLTQFKISREDYNKLLSVAKETKNKEYEGAVYLLRGITFSNSGDFKNAIVYHNLHLNIAIESRNKVNEGIAYSNLGIAFWSLGDFKKAGEYHNLHLMIAKELGDKAGEGCAYANLGSTFLKLSDFKKAIEYHTLDLAIAKEIGDKTAEGRAYANLGNAFYGLGDYKKGIEYHKLSLSIAKKVGNRAHEGNTYGNLGIGLYNLGDFKKVVHYHNLHLSISKELGDKAMEGRACGNLGNAFYHLGDLKKSIEYFNLNLEIAKKLGNKYEEGGAYGSLGNAFYVLCDFKKAIDYLLLSLSTAEDAGNTAFKGLMCRTLGNCFFQLGNIRKAMEYHQVDLSICKDVGDRDGEGHACCNLGNDYLGLGDFEKAIEYYKRHLSISEELGGKNGAGSTYGNLGNVYRKLGKPTKALHYHNLALGIAKEVQEKVAEGRAYAYLGNDFQILGESRKAMYYYNLQLSIAKDLGDKTMEGLAYYSLGHSCELQGHLSEALQYFQSSVRLCNDVRSLLQSKDEWKIGFRNKQHLAYNALWRILLKEDRIAEALFAAEEGRAQALTDLMESQYGVRASQSRSHEQPVKDSDVLKCISSSAVFQALDTGTITSWALVEGRVVGFKQNKLERDVTALVQSAYNMIGVRAGIISCENRSMDALRKDFSPDTKYNERVSLPSLPQGSSLSTFYDVVIKPIANLIQGNELIIVPDGPLWLAPYAAFMDTDSKYLSESFRIRLIPSLTSLKLIADCPEGYHCKNDALLVGDPWVEEVTNSNGEKLLDPLPFARKEVEMIGKILNVTPLIGTKATKREVLKGLSSVALVHIAAHGCMETGEIALTPDPKRSSRIPTEEDYILKMADVLSVKMRARLVVLSCCHSGRGEIKAEGVVGIARAFIGAGARSVLVSLWAIDDKATLEFMKSFYHHLVERKSASESLNQAMKHLRESDKYSDVRYWAPFVLIGDDVTLELGAKN